MNAYVQHQVDPVVRTNLDFRLNEVPRFWFDNDPFRTRMFDALSLTFPVGERYFKGYEHFAIKSPIQIYNNA